MQLPPGTTSHVTRRTYWPVPGRSLISWTEYYGNNQKRVSGAAGAVSVHSNHSQNDQTRPRDCSHGNARARPSLALTHGTRASARFNLTPTFAAARSNSADALGAATMTLLWQASRPCVASHTSLPPQRESPRGHARRDRFPRQGHGQDGRRGKASSPGGTHPHRRRASRR